jgi:flagellar hook protein FlgE
MTVSATALVGLWQALQRADQAAEGIRKAAQAAHLEEDQLDLSEEAVGLLVANNGYDAAIALAKTADEMSQQAMDLLG